MKRYLLSLSALLFILMVNAQTGEILESIVSTNLNTNAETTTSFDYNLNGDILSEVDTEFDATSGTSVNSERRTFSHTEGQIVRLKEIWNTATGAWENKDQWTYVQNELGNDVLREFLVWDGSSFVNSQKQEVIYNGNAQVTERKYFTTDDAGDWIENYKYTYARDADGIVDLAFRLNYNVDTDNYEPYKRWSYSRNTDGQLESSIESDFENGTLVNYRKRIYDNSADGAVNSIVYQDWDSVSGSWISQNKRSYTYNEQGNIEAMTYSDDPSDFSGTPQYQYDYGYEGMNADLVILPYYWDDDYREDHYQDEKLQNTDYSYRSSTTGLLEPVTSEVRIYSILDGFVGVENISAESIVVYPNPTTESIFLPKDISAEYVSIYSISGILTKKTFRLNDSQIDVSALSRGNYILKIQTENETYISKFQKL